MASFYNAAIGEKMRALKWGILDRKRYNWKDALFDGRKPARTTLVSNTTLMLDMI